MVESSFSKASFNELDPSRKLDRAAERMGRSEDLGAFTRQWLSRYVLMMAGLTFFLMALGSATRVMNAGLSCPDWPLCYGELIPSAQMNLRVFLEWFHRLIATGMGLLAIGLVAATVWWRQSLPSWAPWMAGGAFALVVVQGILGGLTVTELLRFDIVTAHLGTGLLFFSTLLVMGILLWPSVAVDPALVPRRLPVVGAVAASLVYAQSLLGGLVASQWALHQCFAAGELCLVMNGHLAGILPASLATVVVVVMVWLADLTPTLKRLGYLSGLVLAAQIALGVMTFKLHLQVEPLTVAHQAVGAALLGSLLVLTVVAFKQKRGGQDPIEGSPVH